MSITASSTKPAPALLVVSSDRSSTEALQACLNPPHYSCVLVPNGGSALERMHQSRFRLVIAEMRLPDTNGLELLQRAAAVDPLAGMVLICSYRDWELAIEAMRAGALDCLIRPLHREGIAAAVARALERQRAESERRIFERLLEETLAERTEHVYRALWQLEHSQRSTLETLAMALDSRERLTHLHSLRVQAFTVLLAERCGYHGAGMPELAYGALLHDIGKIVIPDAILLKSGALEPEEQRIMQQHTTRGYQILTRIPYLRPSAVIALCHHERVDGKGYPLGLRGEEIPMEARIFTVADALDAILSGRPYCPPRGLAEAREELRRCAGTQFDEDVVEAFLEVAEEEWSRIQDAVAGHCARTDPPLPILHGTPL
ncbi:MAG TPA: HD domain-containing phosphohydrolase [Terriglobia bacterium]|nr:HD domain-containing phosphohydrolase [Terriglobia bacterium]